MKVKTTVSHNVTIYIGSKEGSSNRSFSERELIEKIKKFNAAYKLETKEREITVRINKNRYVCSYYSEKGFEISVINYPRFPRPVDVLDNFMMELASYLLVELKQHRISVSFPDRTIMLESDDAKE